MNCGADTAPFKSFPKTSAKKMIKRDALKMLMVDLANANDAKMDGTMEPVERIIADNDVVFALWQDETEPHCAGMLLVKGQKLLLQAVAKDKPVEAEISAIKCIDADQAEALLQLYGERDAQH